MTRRLTVPVAAEPDGLRAELLAEATRLRDEHAVALRAVDPELARAAIELSLLIEKLSFGAPYRIRRADLPADHPARRVGDLGDVLILTEADELGRAASDEPDNRTIWVAGRTTGRCQR